MDDLISRKALLEKAFEVPGYFSKMVSAYGLKQIFAHVALEIYNNG